MYLLGSVFSGFCFIFVQASKNITGKVCSVNASVEKESSDGQLRSVGPMHELVRPLFTETDSRFSHNEAAYLKDENEKIQDTLLIPKDIQEESTEDQLISPMTWYLLKRLMSGGNNFGMTSYGAKILRVLRADRILGTNSRKNSFPWDKVCSGGYDHCGGYFPLCCKGFVCLKPLTPWDRRNGFKRCWPHYFQDSDDTNNENKDEEK